MIRSRTVQPVAQSLYRLSYRAHKKWALIAFNMSHFPRNWFCDTFRRTRTARRIIFGESWTWEIPFASHRQASEWQRWGLAGTGLDTVTVITQWGFLKPWAAEFLVRTGLSCATAVTLTVVGCVFCCQPVTAHAQCRYVTSAALNTGSVASCSDGDFNASSEFQIWQFVVVWYRLPCSIQWYLG